MKKNICIYYEAETCRICSNYPFFCIRKKPDDILMIRRLYSFRYVWIEEIITYLLILKLSSQGVPWRKYRKGVATTPLVRRVAKNSLVRRVVTLKRGSKIVKSYSSPKARWFYFHERNKKSKYKTNPNCFCWKCIYDLSCFISKFLQKNVYNTVPEWALKTFSFLPIKTLLIFYVFKHDKIYKYQIDEKLGQETP